MRITDTTLTARLIDESGCMQDGLTMFIGQGRIAVDVCVYHGDSEDETKPDLFILDIYKRKEDFEDTDTFFNISYMQTGAREEFGEIDFQEFYTTREEINLRIVELMNEHSSFDM